MSQGSDQELFVQGILDEPDHITSYLVYADWLEEQGDPQAEFIRLQCELEFNPPKPFEISPLKARCVELLEEHEAKWLGELAPFLLQKKSRKKRTINPWDFSHTFRRGFLDELIFHEFPDALAKLLAPSTATNFLRRLTIDTERSAVRPMKLNKEAKHSFPNLRRLRILSGNPQGIDKLILQAPRLEHLHLRGAPAFITNLFSMQLPYLKELVLISGNIDLSPLLTNATFSSLESLWISTLSDADFDVLIHTDNLPALKNATLGGLSFTDRDLDAIARSGFLNRVMKLELQYHQISQAALERLAQCDFKALCDLTMRGSTLPNGLVEKLTSNQGNVLSSSRPF